MDDFDAGSNRPAVISSGMVVAHYELGDTIGSGELQTLNLTAIRD